MASRLQRWVVLGVAVAMLGGCGVRGALEAPPEAKADAAAQPVGPDGKKEHKPFILDRLIR